jgi:hypothetical protein
MVRQSFSRLQVFVSTIPASVTKQRGVTPSAGILGYREGNDGHVMACFAVNVETNDRAYDNDQQFAEPALRAGRNRHAVRAGDERVRSRACRLEGARCPQNHAGAKRDR